tara:strand:- start:1738 stop:2313 length:576 start_codon:yes stop_codon:yes gene_type:complete
MIMTVLRHYFISEDLEDLVLLEQQLEEGGVDAAQTHVLSLDDQNLEGYERLHDVNSIMKKDVIRSGVVGAVIGLALSLSLLVVAALLGWAESKTGWMPFILLSIIIFGFCAWEGGLFGIQTPNKKFARFEDVLNAGKHVFFVDLAPEQEEVLARLMTGHPSLKAAGTDRGTPRWITKGQKNIPTLLRETLP